MSKFVTAVNARGDKQVIPTHWLDDPKLGKDFKLPPSTKAKASDEKAEQDKPSRTKA